MFFTRVFLDVSLAHFCIISTSPSLFLPCSMLYVHFIPSYHYLDCRSAPVASLFDSLILRMLVSCFFAQEDCFRYHYSFNCWKASLFFLSLFLHYLPAYLGPPSTSHRLDTAFFLRWSIYSLVITLPSKTSYLQMNFLSFFFSFCSFVPFFSVKSPFDKYLDFFSSFSSFFSLSGTVTASQQLTRNNQTIRDRKSSWWFELDMLALYVYSISLLRYLFFCSGRSH